MTRAELATAIMEDMHKKMSVYATEWDHKQLDKQYKGYINRCCKSTLEMIYNNRKIGQEDK